MTALAYLLVSQPSVHGQIIAKSIRKKIIGPDILFPQEFLKVTLHYLLYIAFIYVCMVFLMGILNRGTK